MTIERFLYLASIWILPVLLAITVHEAAHAWTAWRLGDNTAHADGRVSVDPLRHVDPIGTVLVPMLLLLTRAPFLIGWAKPVPVNEAAFRNPSRDGMLVAAAGPAANLLAAFACALLLNVVAVLPDSAFLWAFHNLFNAVRLNLVLAVFNMLPVLPLDGGRVMLGLLPPSAAQVYLRHESYGIMLLVMFLFILPELGSSIGINLNFVRVLIGSTVGILFDGLTAITGLTAKSGV